MRKTMAKKSSKRNIRKLTKIAGHSYGITLPISVIREFGWKERQKLQLKISKRTKEIRIRDWEN